MSFCIPEAVVVWWLLAAGTKCSAFDEVTASCTYHVLQLLSFVFSAQFIYVIISENTAFHDGGSFSISYRTLSKNISPSPLSHSGMSPVDLIILHQLPGSL